MALTLRGAAPLQNSEWSWSHQDEVFGWNDTSNSKNKKFRMDSPLYPHTHGPTCHPLQPYPLPPDADVA
jgi:hypothetical protein